MIERRSYPASGLKNGSLLVRALSGRAALIIAGLICWLGAVVGYARGGPNDIVTLGFIAGVLAIAFALPGAEESDHAWKLAYRLARCRPRRSYRACLRAGLPLRHLRNAVAGQYGRDHDCHLRRTASPTLPPPTPSGSATTSDFPIWPSSPTAKLPSSWVAWTWQICGLPTPRSAGRYRRVLRPLPPAPASPDGRRGHDYSRRQPLPPRHQPDGHAG